MDVFLLIAIFGLGYALFRQAKSNSSSSSSSTSVSTIVTPPGYNPYILNQFQELKDRIFSADIRENHIERKPTIQAAGVYGITENQIKLNPTDSITIIYGPKHRLNV